MSIDGLTICLAAVLAACVLAFTGCAQDHGPVEEKVELGDGWSSIQVDVDGIRLRCVYRSTGAGQTKTTATSCDWVGWHLQKGDLAGR